MPNPVSVKWFSSAMSGAPVLSGQAGKMIDWFNACLVDGFGSVTLDSIVVSANVATATKSAGHGFLDYAVVLIAGATPSGLNGEKRITRTGATTFTFDATGISNQTATGTITAKMAPAGWSVLYTGTHKIAWTRGVGATPQKVRLLDDTAQYPTLYLYETMSDIDTGTGVAAFYAAKSDAADSSPRGWEFYADAAALYWFVQTASGSSDYFACGFLGDIAPYLESDIYHSAILGMPSATYYYGNLASLAYAGSSGGGLGKLIRSHSQTGVAVESRNYSHANAGYTFGNIAGVAYPNPCLGGLLAWPVEIWEGTTVPRGLMPGLFDPIHGSGPAQGTLIDTVPHFPDRKFRTQYLSNGGSASFSLIDVTGPWR